MRPQAVQLSEPSATVAGIACPRCAKHAALERRLDFARVAVVIHISGRAGTVRAHVHDVATAGYDEIEGEFEGEAGPQGFRSVAGAVIHAAIASAAQSIFAR